MSIKTVLVRSVRSQHGRISMIYVHSGMSRMSGLVDMLDVHILGVRVEKTSRQLQS